MSRILITAQNYWFWGGAVENIREENCDEGRGFLGGTDLDHVAWKMKLHWCFV